MTPGFIGHDNHGDNNLKRILVFVNHGSIVNNRSRKRQLVLWVFIRSAYASLIFSEKKKKKKKK